MFKGIVGTFELTHICIYIHTHTIYTDTMYMIVSCLFTRVTNYSQALKQIKRDKGDKYFGIKA